MLATLQGHGFRWSTGRERLLIVSIGTGSFLERQAAEAIMADPAAMQGISALQSLMNDCERMNRAMLQWLTHCLTPWIVDNAVGDMKLDSEAGPQLATYVRYNVLLEQDWLKRELGVELTPGQIEQICKMDDPRNLSDLADLGRRAAAKQVKPEYLPSAFDVVEL